MSTAQRSTVSRVLDAAPVESFDAYVAAGGGAGLAAAAGMDPTEVIAVIKAAGYAAGAAPDFPPA